MGLLEFKDAKKDDKTDDTKKEKAPKEVKTKTKETKPTAKVKAPKSAATKAQTTRQKK
ncbi:MAG: hypothetical protein LRY27_04715 [Chitinophagales bacterium]|nr:hypothetical protein [Chitinophagales bacterium]